MILKMIRGKGWMAVPRERSLILCCYVSLSLSILSLSSCPPAPVSLSPLSLFFSSTRGQRTRNSTRTADTLEKPER